VIDATEPIAAQDAHIAGYVWEAGKGLVVVVNKWDLVVPKDDHTLDFFTKKIQRELHFIREVPMLFTSALTRQRVRRILDLALDVKDLRVQRISTGELNKVIQDALKKHQPVSHSGKMLKLRYVTQVGISPPTFVFFVNDPEIVHFSYRRFLENQLREQFKFTGTALRLIFRSSREAPEVAFSRTNAGAPRKKASVSGQRSVRKTVTVRRGERAPRVSDTPGAGRIKRPTRTP
jgi:GTP-binding protein